MAPCGRRSPSSSNWSNSLLRIPRQSFRKQSLPVRATIVLQQIANTLLQAIPTMQKKLFLNLPRMPAPLYPFRCQLVVSAVQILSPRSYRFRFILVQLTFSRDFLRRIDPNIGDPVERPADAFAVDVKKPVSLESVGYDCDVVRISERLIAK